MDGEDLKNEGENSVWCHIEEKMYIEWQYQSKNIKIRMRMRMSKLMGVTFFATLQSLLAEKQLNTTGNESLFN